MKIEATDTNKRIINKAQMRLSKAHDAAWKSGYGHTIGDDIRTLRGMLLTGDIDDQHLSSLKGAVNVLRHDRKAKDLRKHAIEAFDLIAMARLPEGHCGKVV